MDFEDFIGTIVVLAVIFGIPYCSAQDEEGVDKLLVKAKTTLTKIKTELNAPVLKKEKTEAQAAKVPVCPGKPVYVWSGWPEPTVELKETPKKDPFGTLEPLAPLEAL